MASPGDVFEVTAFGGGHALVLLSLSTIAPSLVAAAPLGGGRAHFGYCPQYLVGSRCCGDVKHGGHASVSAMGWKRRPVTQLSM